MILNLSNNTVFLINKSNMTEMRSTSVQSLIFVQTSYTCFITPSQPLSRCLSFHPHSILKKQFARKLNHNSKKCQPLQTFIPLIIFSTDYSIQPHWQQTVPTQPGQARMGLMSQGKHPSTQSHYLGKIKTKGNCYCHRLLHPWGGRGDTLSNQNSNEKYKNT